MTEEGWHQQGKHDSQARRCPVDGCNKWHRFQFTIPHDRHEALKQRAKLSRFPTMTDLVLWIIETFLDGGNITGDHMLGTPPAPRIAVRLADLVAAEPDEVLDFGRTHNLIGMAKRDVIRATVESDRFVIPDLPMESRPYQCGFEDCGDYGHNTRTCPRR